MNDMTLKALMVEVKKRNQAKGDDLMAELARRLRIAAEALEGHLCMRQRYALLHDDPDLVGCELCDALCEIEGAE